MKKVTTLFKQASPIPNNKIPGNIGRIDAALHKNLLERLAKYLVNKKGDF